MILVYRRFSLINTGQEIVLIIRSDLYTNIIQYNLLIIRSLNHFAIFRVPCVTEALMPEKGQLLQAIQEMNDDVLKPEKVHFKLEKKGDL